MNPSQPQVVIIKNETNPLALAGLIFSVLGWGTCGLLCIVGAPLSLFALFSKGPKGLAVAGLIVGFPGVIFFFVVGSGLVAGALGIGAAATAVSQAEARPAEAHQGGEATFEIDEPDSQKQEEYERAVAAYNDCQSKLPSLKVRRESLQSDLDALEVSRPDALELESMTWSAKDSDHQAAGRYVSSGDGKVSILLDSGKIATIELDKLIATDRLQVSKLKEEKEAHDKALEEWTAKSGPITQEIVSLTTEIELISSMEKPSF